MLTILHWQATARDAPPSAGLFIDQDNPVGSCHVWGCAAYGFLDNHGVHTTIDLPGSHLTEPISINAKGQIVGVYREQGEPGDDRT
jgi:hypothetical protein